MKKIIILALLLLGVNTVNAQYTKPVDGLRSLHQWGSMTMPFYTSGDDTATNADVLRAGVIMNGRYDVGIKVVSTKVLGTVAGTIYVRGSFDGTNWFSLADQETKVVRDTATMADATTTYIFAYEAVNAKYLEVYYNQTGGTSAPVMTINYRRVD